MPAPKGNKFWEARSSHGRKPIYETPEQLWDASLQYFQWVEDNPLSKSIIYQGEVTGSEDIRRPMTIEGYTLFIGLGQQALKNYEMKEDFVGVITAAREVIRQQKLEGAMIGAYNASIVARDLGLKDNQDVTSGGQPVQNNWTITPVTTKKDADG